MPGVIQCGPEAVRYVRNGVTSRIAQLTQDDGPEQARQIGRALKAEILPLLAFRAWHHHRIMTAAHRKFSRLAREQFGDVWHPGPRPDLVAIKPWKEAKVREWCMLPPAVVARLLRGGW